jgi:hypothetical protein
MHPVLLSLFVAGAPAVVAAVLPRWSTQTQFQLEGLLLCGFLTAAANEVFPAIANRAVIFAVLIYAGYRIWDAARTCQRDKDVQLASPCTWGRLRLWRSPHSFSRSVKAPYCTASER